MPKDRVERAPPPAKPDLNSCGSRRPTRRSPKQTTRRGELAKWRRERPRSCAVTDEVSTREERGPTQPSTAPAGATDNSPGRKSWVRSERRLGPAWAPSSPARNPLQPCQARHHPEWTQVREGSSAAHNLNPLSANPMSSGHSGPRPLTFASGFPKLRGSLTSGQNVKWPVNDTYLPDGPSLPHGLL